MKRAWVAPMLALVALCPQACRDPQLPASPPLAPQVDSIPDPQPEADEPPVQTSPPVHLDEGVLARSAVYKRIPQYPAAARQAGIGGTVVVECVISEAGEVIESRVIQGNPLLREGAAEAVRAWRFWPIPRDGPRIRRIGIVRFSFDKSSGRVRIAPQSPPN
jgi:TonB family protein